MSIGFAPKLATATIDLSEFGGEGIITVQALSTCAAMELAKIGEKYKNQEDSLVAGIETAIYVCKKCIIDAPFEITDEAIDNFPPELTTKISAVVFGLQKEIPLV